MPKDHSSGSEESPHQQWVEAATDYVHERGLIGLSLRPLASALGTSDRMLIYRFGSKDRLVAQVLNTSTARATAYIAALPPSADPQAAVEDLWSAMMSPTIDRCTRLYVEAAALRLFGREPYATIVRESNAFWAEAVVRHLARSGVSEGNARRWAKIVEATFAGLQLDMPLEEPVGQLARQEAVADLAVALRLLDDHRSSSMPR